MVGPLSPSLGTTRHSRPAMLFTCAVLLMLGIGISSTSTFLVGAPPVSSKLGQRSSALRPSAVSGAAPEGQSDQELGWGSSLLLLMAAARVARDVACFAAAPKRRATHMATRRRKIRWYKIGEHKARKALELGRAIKSGTIDFIYGKPRDDDEEDDDDYDDDYDSDDDELDKKSLS
eukprot:TRINITY_DN78787_c0_g1_i1.p1 TRINITY_DN78787_c0_g1~~TRINITY_DN78787_c0_g1_i1.p1  ORF type:complete len:176 (-),score=41.59 TRINITY_DN78787_c0_g1_i1:43-570(-)